MRSFWLGMVMAALAGVTCAAAENGTVSPIFRAAEEGNLKLAKVLIEFVDAPNPPVRLPLGSDTAAATEAKAAELIAVVGEWRSVAVSTDFPVEQAA